MGKFQQKPLSERSEELLQAYIDAEGDVDRVARALAYSKKHVNNQLNYIFSAFGAPNRVAGVIVAIKRGWIKV